MARVKICGITSWADARLALNAGVDLLGFNFYSRSPRFISPRAARRIVARLPQGVEAVGVFVNEHPDEVEAIAYEAKLDFVQLHGEESPRTVHALAREVDVIKAFRVRPGFRATRLASFSDAAAFLLDGFHPQKKGGTGRTFDWNVALRARRYGLLFLAGGITPENVGDAIRDVQPYAVDVCSGVESRPGKKDAAKLRALMHAVEQANREIR